MAKVTGVFEKVSAKGTKYWIAQAEGLEHQILYFKFVKLGDEVDPALLELNDKGDTYKFKAGTDGKTYQDKKASYQKNDDLIIAQVAYKGILELVNGGKMEVSDINETMIVRHGVWIKKASDLIRIMTDPAYAPPAVTAAPAEKSPVAASPSEFNLEDVLACDWTTFEKKDYDTALAGMAKYKKLSGASAKAFLVDQFGIESSSLIPRGKRNEVIKNMAALANG